MKNFIKRNVLPSLVKLNVENIFSSLAKGNILNIFYHGVVEKDSTAISPRHIQKEQFEQHLKYLTTKFNIISLTEAFDIYRQEIIPNKKTVTVSFDDGYLNNLTIALPLLEKYKVKATFFISSMCAENETSLIWADIVSLAHHFSCDSFIEIENKKFHKTGRYELINKSDNQSIFDYIKKLSCAEREYTLNSIIDRYKIYDILKKTPVEYWKLMNKNDLKKLTNSDLVTIGSHGHLHYNLGNISLEDAKIEMKKSREILSNTIEKEVNLLSFPDGSYTETVKQLAVSLGYNGLLAVNYHYPSDKADKNILNRWGVSSGTTFETIAFALNHAFIKHSF